MKLFAHFPTFIFCCCMFIFPRSVQTFGCKRGNKEFQKQYQRMKNEWKMAKIALIVILFFVISWSPYSVVALVAFAG